MQKTTLAELSGIHRTSLYRYLKGEIPLSNRKLTTIWDTLLSYKK